MMGSFVLTFAKAINKSIDTSNDIEIKTVKYQESPEAREKRLARVMRKYYVKKSAQEGVCRFCGATVFYNSRAGRMPVACKKVSCKREAMKQGGKFKEKV